MSRKTYYLPPAREWPADPEAVAGAYRRRLPPAAPVSAAAEVLGEVRAELGKLPPVVPVLPVVLVLGFVAIGGAALVAVPVIGVVGVPIMVVAGCPLLAVAIVRLAGVGRRR